ncbi:hypothetical protein RclHR1_00050002 [Rhizophagus clarus]|uniref:BTB domain-containing protein n=1 Tax=Rhizophagus clarus TaxID=94130 RepID=A0A2Z6RL89_9GLOM|nr:hypothetical protein RclHR1_00050002 [Rhizophagus clarus]
MSFEYSQELANDFEKLFEGDEECNVIIYAGENKSEEEIHAHSNILRTRSQYFRTILSNKTTKKKDEKFVVCFPNIQPQFFRMILRFIYCGKIDLAKLQGTDILKLLTAADELKIQRLLICVQEYLIKYRHEFLRQFSPEILEATFLHDSFTDLWDYCLEEICAEPDTLFKSDKFTNLKEPLLELLLRRDDLSMNEIDIWNNLIRWCFSQHPSIEQDIDKWSEEEIVIMKKTIHKFIPLIRFYHIPSTDFIANVYPFKEIIPKDLINDILVFHAAPDEHLNVDIQRPRKPKFVYDSSIVDNNHFAIFSSWIEKRNQFHYSVKGIPYNFNLLYRASRDGNTAADFHTKCDNKGATIVIVKISNSNQIVGGYNPLFWVSNNTFRPSCDSFIFSFASKDNLKSAKAGYSNGDEYSIGCYLDYGPLFGGGNDLGFYNNKWYRNKSYSYPDVGIPLSRFKTDDFEVFQVVRK